MILCLCLLAWLITIKRFIFGEHMFTGSYVALITPMNKDGVIDYSALQELVEFHIQAGTEGIVSVGTTGESATLPFDEHIEVVKKTVQYAEGVFPVIAGSGANSTEEAIYLSRHLAKSGVSGFLSVVPYYNKPQQRGLVAHFEAIANATDLPTLLYNVPSRTVVDMQTPVVLALAKHPNIIGIKDATGDLSRLAQMQSVLPKDFLFLSGDDSSSAAFLNAGGDGVISVTANIVPKHIAELCRLAKRGDADKVLALDAKLAELHQALFVEPNPVMPKWALYKMGLINSPDLRLPMVLPEQENQHYLQQVLANTQQALKEESA